MSYLIRTVRKARHNGPNMYGKLLQGIYMVKSIITKFLRCTNIYYKVTYAMQIVC